MKAEVGKQIDRLRREFIDDGMGFKTLQKQGQEQNGDKNVSMNLKEKVLPTAGVDVKNGEEVIKGQDYYTAKANGRLTRQQYQEQYESM